MGYQKYLRDVVRASVGPYGYTLTVWTTGSIATHAYGSLPSPVDVLLLLAGAVTGFGTVSACAFGVRGAFGPGRFAEIRPWGGIHLPSVGSSIVLTTAITKIVYGWVIWPLVGFTATTTYLLVTAAQFMLVGQRANRSGGAGGKAAETGDP